MRNLDLWERVLMYCINQDIRIELLGSLQSVPRFNHSWKAFYFHKIVTYYNKYSQRKFIWVCILYIIKLILQWRKSNLPLVFTADQYTGCAGYHYFSSMKFSHLSCVSSISWLLTLATAWCDVNIFFPFLCSFDFFVQINCRMAAFSLIFRSSFWSAAEIYHLLSVLLWPGNHLWSSQPHLSCFFPAAVWNFHLSTVKHNLERKISFQIFRNWVLHIALLDKWL